MISTDLGERSEPISHFRKGGPSRSDLGGLELEFKKIAEAPVKLEAEESSETKTAPVEPEANPVVIRHRRPT